MMAMASTRHTTETRQAQIVAAMIALAATRSPAEISAHDLAAAVGLSSGGLFRHFDSKEVIGVAVIRWVEASLLVRLAEAARHAGGPLEALGAVFRAHVDFVVAHPGVPRIVFHALQQPGDVPLKRAVNALLGGYRGLVAGLIEQARGGGLLRADIDSMAAIALFIGGVQGLVMQAMATGDVAGMLLRSDKVFEVWLGGVRAPGGG